MRDPKRMNRILKLIKKHWERAPDMRFGQLLIYLEIAKDNPKTWNREDDELEQNLKKVEK